MQHPSSTLELITIRQYHLSPLHPQLAAIRRQPTQPPTMSQIHLWEQIAQQQQQSTHMLQRVRQAAAVTMVEDHRRILVGVEVVGVRLAVAVAEAATIHT